MVFRHILKRPLCLLFDSQYFFWIISASKPRNQRNRKDGFSSSIPIYAQALSTGQWIYRKFSFLLIDRKLRSEGSSEVVKLASCLQLHFPCQNGLLFPGKKYELRSKQDKICHSFTNSNHKGIVVDIYLSSAIVRTRTFLESSIIDWYTNSKNETRGNAVTRSWRWEKAIT